MKFLKILALLMLTTKAFASLPEGYTGSYKGKFNGKEGTLVLTEAADRLSVRFVASSGPNDILGSTCNSEIGQMTKLDFDHKNGLIIIDEARFQFNPGTCANVIEGREFTMDFKHQNGIPTAIEASLFSHSEEQSVPNCHGGAEPDCTDSIRTINYYKLGKFKK